MWCSGNQQYSMHMAPHQMMQQQPPMAAAHGIIPAAGTQAQFSAASTPTGLVTTPPAATPPAMMLVQQPGQGPAAAAAAASGGMYAPMQMAGVPMPQVGMGGAAAAAAAATTGQNPGGPQEIHYNTLPMPADGGGGVHYIEYPAANSLLVPPPFCSSDAPATDQIR